MSKLKIIMPIICLLAFFAVMFSCTKKSVIIDILPPSVTITSPADNAILSGDTVLVTVTASDNQRVSRVEFLVDGALKFTDLSAPFVFPWLILVFNDSTLHTLQAVAFDPTGNSDTSTINVTIRVAAGFHFIGSAASAGISYYNLFLWGNYASMAARGDGIEIFDISNPANPQVLSFYSAGAGLANGVFVSGGYLFIAYGQEGLHVLDVGNPSAPSYKSSVVLPGFGDVENVFVAGNYAYLAAKNAGLYMVDIGNLDTLQVAGPPYQVGSGIAYDVKVVDTLAYLAYGDVGLEIVNVKDPSNPTFVGRYSPAGSANVRRLAISGNRAYLALENAGLEIVNIANPAAPAQLGNFNTFNSFFTGVVLDGFTAFAANRDDGVQIVDVTIPNNPTAGLFYNTEGQANNLVFDNSFIYLADQSSLTVLRYVP
jgi:hypothetical protein